MTTMKHGATDVDLISNSGRGGRAESAEMVELLFRLNRKLLGKAICSYKF